VTLADDIEAAITGLVQQAPALDAATLDELVRKLRGVGSPLALAIARVVELVGTGRVDAGVALPALAMACATLGDGLRGRVSERELEAARYEVETLLPLPDREKPVVPDVPVDGLIRGPRPRT
jgi:hypothetical protein